MPVTRRMTSSFLIALIISGLCTLLLSRKLHSRQPAVARRQYAAAAVALTAGEVLKEDKLKMIDWPESFPLPGAFPQTKDLVGRSVLYPLAAGEPVLERDLMVPGAGLTVKIPDGMRAVALRSDEVVGVAGFLFPGSHVDVLVTYRSDKTPEPVTTTVLQDAEVLAAGQQVQPRADGKPESVNVVTLLMKPDDAERVVLASTQGSIHFVLRNSGDHEQVPDMPATLSQLDPALDVPRIVPRPRSVAVPKSKPYVVETILGDKETSTSFNE